MRDIIRSAETRINSHASAAAEQFETAIMHNAVHERVPESDRLRELVDVVERAYRLEESETQPQDVRRTAFGAAEELDEHIERLVEDVVARECDAVATCAHSWTDHYDGEDLDRAISEAQQWLDEHEGVVERVGIDRDSDEVMADV